MALSDLLYPIFLFPSRPTLMYLDGWLIGGPLGQALPKLPSFLADACTLVSVQSLILITLDRFQATVVHLRSPLISLETWMGGGGGWGRGQSPYLIAFQLVEYPKGMKCKKRWPETLGETTYSNYLLAVIAIMFFYIPFVLFLLLYSIVLFGHPRGTWGFSKLQGLQYYFPENFRCNLTFYESQNFSDSSVHYILESENFRFPFSKKNSVSWVVKCEKLNFRKL